jgi:hypothetical protein
MSELQDRVNLLEAELAQAATALQTVHPIGQVKPLGLREVGLAAEQVAEMLTTAEARIAELEREIRDVRERAIEAESRIVSDDQRFRWITSHPCEIRWSHDVLWRVVHWNIEGNGQNVRDAIDDAMRKCPSSGSYFLPTPHPQEAPND